jgi:hypothetical protein
VITHIVTFQFTDPDEAELQRCKAMLEGLLGPVPSLRSMVVGVNVVDSPRSHHLALVATFDDLEGLDAYQVHPAHEEVAAHLRELAPLRPSVDFVS